MNAPDKYSAAFMDRARQALNAARLDVEHDQPEAAINRAYYAAFYATRAALYQEGESPRSHKGVRVRLAERFVRTGRLDRATAGILHAAEVARLKADYDAFSVFDTAAAQDLIADVERFVEAIETLLAPSA